MKYISTRGATGRKTFGEVLLMGLAPDGGLMLPEHYPQIDRAALDKWRGLAYADLAFEIMRLFATDIPEGDLSAIINRTYTAEAFGNAEITPVRTLSDGLKIQALSNGPTLAFKDMAMQFLGNAFEYVLKREGQTLNIVGATSGDTGSAAEYALRGKEGIHVFMMSPEGKMSAFQRAQMYSLQDENIHNIAVRGVFDDCQALVKALSNDADFKAAHHLGAVNSINIGRIAAQAVYYVWSWLRVTDAVEEGARAGYRVDVCVPSGNFGNIYAGFLARSMGVPIRRLILATNENNVLEEFFTTGIYRPRSAADTLATSSPSMDISKASNLERFIWALLGPEAFVQRWAELETTGTLDLRDERARLGEELGFVAGASSHTDRLEAIRSVKERSGRLIDPHTADGVTVALRTMEPGFPTLVMETAKAAKFPQTVAEALGTEPETPDVIADLLAQPQKVETIDNDQAPLRALIEEHALSS